jgi:hypothetical protein
MRLKVGVGAYESLLEPIGLGGHVPDRVRRTLLECQQVRNVIVHRNGVCDTRLVQACPWLGLKIGETISVHKRAFERYSTAVRWYILEMSARAQLSQGREKPAPGRISVTSIRKAQSGLLEDLGKNVVASELMPRAPHRSE